MLRKTAGSRHRFRNPYGSRSLAGSTHDAQMRKWTAAGRGKWQLTGAAARLCCLFCAVWHCLQPQTVKKRQWMVATMPLRWKIHKHPLKQRIRRPSSPRWRKGAGKQLRLRRRLRMMLQPTSRTLLSLKPWCSHRYHSPKTISRRSWSSGRCTLEIFMPASSSAPCGKQISREGTKVS